MKKVFTDQLKGGEILSKDLHTPYNVLIVKGTVLKKEYIERFPLLGIEYVYIEETDTKDDAAYATARDIVREEIKRECNVKVRQLLETHIYRHNKELANLCVVAEKLIDNILEDEKIQEKVVEVKDAEGDLYSHSVNVCGLSVILALKMGLSKEQAEEIAKGSILHDLGLRYITQEYEDIAVEQMAVQDKVEYYKHALQGFQAVQEEKWLSQTAKDIILFHHEAEDGSGYPLHLKGDKLSLAIKIVIVCETFDQMLNGIGYKRTRLQEIIEYLKYHRGKLFDKKVTNEFLKMIIQFPVNTIVVTNQGEVGRVIRQNKEMTDRPVILITKDRNGMELNPPHELDLCKVLNVFIESVQD